MPDAGEEREAVTLAARLRARIRREGAVSFYEWMRAALYDEREGYYRRSDRARWGRGGDYRTSPERSVLFASTFARYFAALYEQLGRPAGFDVLEAGGGAGHFACGVLQTLERDEPQIFQRVRYIFEEASEDARNRAAAMLSPFDARIEFRRPGETAAPLESGVIFSNELLDAFPVYRAVVRGGRLRELFVGADEDGAFYWLEAEPSTPRLAQYFERAGVYPCEGRVVEVNLEAGEWIEKAARLVRRGFVVTVDYGDETENLYNASERREGTLRAFSGHAFGNVLERPGEQDLTATVDWTHLKRAGERAGLRTILHERQDSFLLRAGLLDRLERETTYAGDEAEIARLRLDAREMILPGGMGEHFQVLVQEKDA